MQIKRKKYQVAGNTKLPNLLTLTTPSKISNYNNQYNALNNTIPSPTLSNDNWQYKPEQKAKPVINASSFIPNSTAVQDNTKTIKSDYNAKPNNNIVSYFDYKGDVKSVDIPYQGTAVPSEPKTLYNTYFNTPSNTKGTGIIPFASNMINASNVVGAGMAAKEGIKYGIKKAGQYANKKMLNYGKDAFTPNLSNVGENLLENKSSLINSQTIDLQRNVAPKVKVAKLSFDDVDLGNGLVLRNNPSRTTDQTKILGKNMALKEVLDKETGEYIKLSSWTDENGKLFYKMSANMPSSRLKAGKAYLELEKHIPVGATLMDDTSLSYDSFLNTVKQTKNPKFKTIVHNEFPMNNSSKTVSGLKNKYTGQNLAFATKEEAEQNLTKINELLQKHNLPNAKINYQTQYIDDGDELTYYGITIPQIGLEKLYQLGIPLTALGLSQQNQNNSYRKLGGKLMKKSYKYGGKFQFGAKSLNKIGADEFSSTSSRKPQSINSFTPKNTLSSDNAKVIKTTYKKTNKNVTSFIDGQGKVRTAVIPNQGTIAKAEPKTLYNTYFNNPITTHGIGMVPFMNNMINAADIVGVGKVATNIGEKAIQNRVNAN